MNNQQSVMAEIGCVEHPFLKVPLDEVVRLSKSCQKMIDTEMVNLVKAFDELTSNPGDNPSVVDARLQAMQQQLEQLEQQAHEIRQAEETVVRMYAARVRHLHSAESISEDLWKQLRVNRFLADYLLRNGFYKTAEQLAKLPALQGLINTPLFRQVQVLEQDIKDRNFEPVLAWYEKHEQRLKRFGSTLRFKLELQIFVEMVRRNEKTQALQYARTAFPKHAQRHMLSINKAMGVLIFPDQDDSKELLSPQRVEDLIGLLRHNNFALHSLTAQSAFDATLQIGISAYKTVHCAKPKTKLNSCPTCSPDMQLLAAKLPSSMQTTSRLYCRITGELMNEYNPPYMLPNGHVYSEQALKNMQKEKGSIRCPETGDIFDLNDCKRVFIV